jgi:hypothetical protein
MDNETLILMSIIIGTLAAVVYALRMLVLMDQKLDKILLRK